MNTSMNQAEAHGPARKAVWLRGLYMLFFLIALGFAQSLINLIAILQFFAMLIFGSANEQVARFGASLGAWLQEVAAFQSAHSETKPFPWGDWPQGN